MFLATCLQFDSAMSVSALTTAGLLLPCHCYLSLRVRSVFFPEIQFSVYVELTLRRHEELNVAALIITNLTSYYRNFRKCNEACPSIVYSNKLSQNTGLKQPSFYFLFKILNF